jgi:hypothetical protein
LFPPCGASGTATRSRSTSSTYEQPVYPKNLYLDRAPYTHAEYRREVIDKQVELMHERDIWARPDNGTPEGDNPGTG